MSISTVLVCAFAVCYYQSREEGVTPFLTRAAGTFARPLGRTARSMRDKAEQTMSRERSHAGFIVVSCAAVLVTLLGVAGISRSVLSSCGGRDSVPRGRAGRRIGGTPRTPHARTMRGRPHRRRGPRTARGHRGRRVVARVPTRRAGGRRPDALLAHHEKLRAVGVEMHGGERTGRVLQRARPAREAARGGEREGRFDPRGHHGGRLPRQQRDCSIH